MRILIVIFCIVILATILTILLLQAKRQEFDVNVKIGINGQASETLEFNDLNLKPGESTEYKMKVECSLDGEYEFSFSFSQTEDGKLAPFVNVDIECNGEIKSENLNTLFFSKKQLKFNCGMSRDKAQELVIKYTMPYEVDNDAKNTWSNFNVLFTATYK